MRECVAAIISEQQKILLAHRSAERAFYPNVWDFFGGHIEADESPVEALVRELQEELGIVPTLWTYWGTLEEPYPEQHGQGLYHIYLVTAWTGTPRNLQTNEHSEIAWFPLQDAILLDLSHPKLSLLLTSML